MKESESMRQRRLAAQDAIYGEDCRTAWCDPAHPVFHLAPPSHCMIDVWGAVHDRGNHHIFMNTTLQRDTDSFCDETYYSHAVSEDYLHWTWLPIPIGPMDSEMRLNDGYADMDDDGRPVILYTAVKKDRSKNDQWAAVGNEDMTVFTRLGEDPMMTMDDHGGPFYQNFSDPYVFRQDGRTFLTISKCDYPDGRSEMPLYEATDTSLTKWVYRGTMFDSNGEVVNFFPVGEKWVLIYSPYHTIQYYVGDFDTETLRFTPIRNGMLSYGYHRQDGPADRGLYATCVFRPENILCGWIGGQTDGNGWSGTMSFPRQLGLDRDNRLTQKPIDGIKTLYEACVVNQSGDLSETVRWELPSSAFDLSAAWWQSPDNRVRLTLTAGDTPLLTLCLTREQFTVNNDTYPRTPARSSHADEVRLLFDHTVGEIFLGHGCDSATFVVPYAGETLSLIWQTQRTMVLDSLTVHTIAPTKPVLSDISSS